MYETPVSRIRDEFSPGDSFISQRALYKDLVQGQKAECNTGNGIMGGTGRTGQCAPFRLLFHFLCYILYTDAVHMNSAALVKHNADYMEQICLIPSCSVPIPRIMRLNCSGTTVKQLIFNQHSDVRNEGVDPQVR